MGQKRDIVAIGVRLVALYLIFQGLMMAPGQISAYLSVRNSDAAMKAAIGSGFFGIGSHLLIGLFIWMFSPVAAKIVCKGIEEQDQQLAVSPAEVQMIAVSILGLYVLSSAIPSLVNVVISYSFPKYGTTYSYVIESSGKQTANIPVADIASIIIKLAFGALCTFRAKGVVIGLRDLWNRTKGMK